MRIMYLPTGNVFDLPKEECKRIYEESPFNYEILDGAFSAEDKTPASTVAQKVLADEEEQEEQTLNDLTVPELKALCDEKEIEYAKSARKAELIALLEANAEVKEENGEDEEEQEETEEEEETDGSDEEEIEEESEE